MNLLKSVIVLSIVVMFNGIDSAPAIAQAKFTMKIASVWSTDDASANKGLNYLKARIEQLSKGSVKVELHKGTLGGEKDLYEGIQLGTIQAGAMTTGTLGSFIPAVELFMVPFLFKDWNHISATVDGHFGDYFKELALKKEMHIFSWWYSGGRQIFGRGKPVVRPDDLKGKKVRVMETPFLVESYKHYGALPTPMAYPEV
jgi:TRAP-type C4-dicarboxylate transport system substrate-binding protein